MVKHIKVNSMSTAWEVAASIFPTDNKDFRRNKKISGNRGCCKMLSSHHRRQGETKGRKSGGWIYRVPVFG